MLTCMNILNLKFVGELVLHSIQLGSECPMLNPEGGTSCNWGWMHRLDFSTMIVKG